MVVINDKQIQQLQYKAVKSCCSPHVTAYEICWLERYIATNAKPTDVKSISINTRYFAATKKWISHWDYFHCNKINAKYQRLESCITNREITHKKVQLLHVMWQIIQLLILPGTDCEFPPTFKWQSGIIITYAQLQIQCISTESWASLSGNVQPLL